MRFGIAGHASAFRFLAATLAILGIGGDTLRKAVAFYLQAAKYAGHPLSKYFKTPAFIAKSSGGPRRQRAAANNNSGDEEEETSPMAPVDPKTRYLEMLMERAANSDELDTTLLDRIEKLLGYSNTGETNA